ncbi:MAG: ABC transporter ATP-binding protein [Faecousia sp.]
MSNLLEVKNLHAYYGGICALNDVSLNVRQGEITAIVGANGAGKSTLMKTIAGDKSINRGTILFDGKPLPDKVHNVVAGGISLVPEGRRIFPSLTVEENLILGTCSRKNFKQAMNDSLDEVLTLFPILKKRYKQAGGTLSGGEQQMLAVARAMMAQPKLICLDEPSLGLAPIIIDEMFEKIVQLNRERGMTVLLVEQNAFLALDVAHHAYVLNTGRITLEGTGDELAANPSVQEEYLGMKSE